MSDTPVKPKSRGRSLVSGIALTLAVLLTPMAMMTNWAVVQVDNTQRFVGTLGPLASNPKIQELVINEITNKLDETVNFKKTTAQLVDGLGSALNLPDAASSALGLVSDPLAAGVKGLVHDAVAQVVTSEGFQKAWVRVLTITQQQVTELLKGQETGVLKMDGDGSITLNLKPVISEVKQSLVNSGVAFAAAIPEVDVKVDLGKVPQLALARVVYQVGVGVGTWLPWVVFALYLLGIGLAVRRARAILTTSIFVLLSSVATLVVFSFGRLFAVNAVGDTYGPTVGVVWDAVSEYAVSVVSGLIALSVITLVASWIFTSDERSPVRSGFSRFVVLLRRRLDAAGATMGSAGHALYRGRIALRVLIIVVAGVIVAMVQPLTVAAVIWACVIVLILLFALELIIREPVAVSARATAKTTSPRSTVRRATSRPVAATRKKK
ncbi:unannotated protein [freshwater metagenome]|uniref:Unannotated protein n=1 Tax=freshwater metagenome TaxID=449393 RepID=A0A6J7FT15_9ZZZZ